MSTNIMMPSVVIGPGGVPSPIVMQQSRSIGISHKSIRKDRPVHSIEPTDTSDLGLDRNQRLQQPRLVESYHPAIPVILSVRYIHEIIIEGKTHWEHNVVHHLVGPTIGHVNEGILNYGLGTNVGYGKGGISETIK